MAYIGFSPSQLAVAPFAVKSFTGDGSTTTFTLDQSVPGANEANVEVFVENVQQNPIDAYTIGGALNNSLIFSEAPVSGAVIYVIHKGESTYNLQPSTGSVTAATLDPVLRNFTVDNFTGDGSTTSFTLTDTPYSANSILVTVDGIVQTASTNYTVSGTTLSFGSSAPDTGSVITVVHMGFSSGNKAVMDASITPVKLSTGGIRWDTSYNAYVGNNATNESATGIQGNLILGGPNGRRIGFAATSDTHYIKLKSSTIDGLDINGYSGLVFSTGSTSNSTWAERLRLDGSGNLLLGGTTVATSSGGLTITNTSSGAMTAPFGLRNAGTANGSGVWITHRGVTAAGAESDYNYIGFVATDTTARTGHITFQTASGGTLAEKMRLDSAGLLTLPYGQIKFPATQNASSDANTLDDYEEGTWTPQAGSESGVFTQTGTFTGKYVKIGNRVWAAFDCSLGSRTLTGSLAFLYGLPFPVANNGDLSGGAGSVGITFNHGTNFYQLAIYPQNNSSYCYFTATTSNTSGLVAATSALWGASTRICGGIWYNTTS
jgi:hypothetical protein